MKHLGRCARIVVGCGVSLWLATAALAQEPLPDRAKIEAGETVYSTYCAPCHGDQLVSTGQIPNLQRLTRPIVRNSTARCVTGAIRCPRGAEWCPTSRSIRSGPTSGLFRIDRSAHPNGGSCHADTRNSRPTWAASQANLRDHAVRLKRRGRHCLGRSCDS